MVLARYNASCVEQEQMANVPQLVTTTSFTLYTFVGLGVGRVIFQPDDLLLCIVSLSNGAADIEFDQSGGAFSHVSLPDKTTVRPREYYHRNQRRRSC